MSDKPPQIKDRPQLPTVRDPTLPDKLYFRLMYREFFWGPFDDEAAVASAMRQLDGWDPTWDYDLFCVIYGADPLPTDYVFGFRSVPREQKDLIEKLRREGDPKYPPLVLLVRAAHKELACASEADLRVSVSALGDFAQTMGLRMTSLKHSGPPAQPGEEVGK